MKLTQTDIDTFNRLSLTLIEKNGIGPAAAMERLEKLQIHLVCGAGVTDSIPLQAALLTAVNSGCRAFLGGVKVTLAKDIRCLLPWYGKTYLHEIVEELGADLSDHPAQTEPRIVFGASAKDEDDLVVVCNDWQAGIYTSNDISELSPNGTIPTAGIFAGAYAVFCVFMKQSGIDITACDQSVGISLWRPDLDWQDVKAAGPAIKYLPAKYWLLGLGHLGQAYTWHIGLLPYKRSGEHASILLQDFDVIVPANQSAGLLTSIQHAGQYKTRRCAEWMEERGFVTHLTERAFDQHTQRTGDEPFLALCGFDSSRSRTKLEQAGFDLVVEAGLGGTLATFDKISLHTFPDAASTPEDIWGDLSNNDVEINAAVLDVLEHMDSDEACGIVSRTISGKAVSASFVGACTGAFVLAETLRGLHAGNRYDKISVQLRDLSGINAVIHKNDIYGIEMGRNGFVTLP